MSDHARLTAAGWRRTTTGRYVHPDAPAIEGSTGSRRRLFTEAEALTLLAAEPTETEIVRLSTDGQRTWNEWTMLITKATA